MSTSLNIFKKEKRRVGEKKREKKRKKGRKISWATKNTYHMVAYI